VIGSEAALAKNSDFSRETPYFSSSSLNVKKRILLFSRVKMGE
jgi:hypothetical protein